MRTNVKENIMGIKRLAASVAAIGTLVLSNILFQEAVAAAAITKF